MYAVNVTVPDEIASDDELGYFDQTFSQEKKREKNNQSFVYRVGIDMQEKKYTWWQMEEVTLELWGNKENQENSLGMK